MYDIVIRNGLVVDGTGAEPRHESVAIKDGFIAEIGDIEEQGTSEIDASNQIVTPGFIDIHTHLDAQMGWDPDMTPVSWHGVTTALIGNCGMTFAPCKPKDQDLLAGMMETVEDIPKGAGDCRERSRISRTCRSTLLRNGGAFVRRRRHAGRSEYDDRDC